MDSVVLDEQYDENYEPTQEEINEYAAYLGIDPVREPQFLWIARKGLKAPLPDSWKPCQTQDEQIYYFNFNSGESIWEHPCDAQFRELYRIEKEKTAPSNTSAKTQGFAEQTQELAVTKPDYLKKSESNITTKVNSPALSHVKSDDIRYSPALPRDKSPSVGRQSPHSRSFIRLQEDISEISSLNSSTGTAPAAETVPKLTTTESAEASATKDRMSKLLQQKIEQLKQQQSAAQIQAPKESPAVAPTTEKRVDTAAATKFGQVQIDIRPSTASIDLEANLHNEKEEREKQLRADMEKWELNERERLAEESKRRLSQMEQSLREKEQSEQERLQQIEQEKTSLEQDLLKLREEHNVRRSSLIQELSDVERKEMSQFEEHMKERRTSWDTERTKLQQDYEQQLSQMQEQWNERIKQSEAEWQTRLERMRTEAEEQEKQYQAQLAEFEERLKQMPEKQVRAEVEANEHAQELERMRKENEALMEEQRRLREEHERQTSKMQEEQFRTSVVLDAPIRLEDLAVPDRGASHDVELSNDVQKRLDQEEAELRQAKEMLEKQRREIMTRQEVLMAQPWNYTETPVAATATRADANTSSNFVEPKGSTARQATNNRLSFDDGVAAVPHAEPGEHFSLDNIENDLTQVLAHLRASNRRYMLPLSRSVRSANYANMSGTGALSRSYLTTSVTPRMAPALREYESHRTRSNQILRDHSMWLKQFRQQMGLERTGAAYTSLSRP